VIDVGSAKNARNMSEGVSTASSGPGILVAHGIPRVLSGHAQAPDLPHRQDRPLRVDGRGAAFKRDDPVAAADQIVKQLGQMKGAAMKIGQVLSTIDFDLVPEDEREAFKEKLAALRDSAPSVPFPQVEKLLRKDLGGPLESVFAEFDREPVAAASIGRCTARARSTAATSRSRSSTRASPRRSRPTCAT
jgi:hypothetical protein